MSSDAKQPEDGQPADDPVDLVRRRLLLAGGKYIAPAVLASLVMEKAWAQSTPSCPPNVNRCGPMRQG